MQLNGKQPGKIWGDEGKSEFRTDWWRVWSSVPWSGGAGPPAWMLASVHCTRHGNLGPEVGEREWQMQRPPGTFLESLSCRSWPPQKAHRCRSHMLGALVASTWTSSPGAQRATRLGRWWLPPGLQSVGGLGRGWNKTIATTKSATLPWCHAQQSCTSDTTAAFARIMPGAAVGVLVGPPACKPSL